LRWVAPGGGDQFVADHQQPEVIARHVALDQDVVAKLGGGRVGLLQLFAS